MADGFLGRWSKRKLEVKEGKPVEAEPVLPNAVIPAKAGIQGALDPRLRGDDEKAEPPPPTLEDAQSLTPESDFTAFTKGNVAPEVKNAAMKKLFSDPHFNVMDRMDVYIDDYSKPDPIPPAMLRQLASAKFLGLFDEEEKEARDVADNPAAQTVAESNAPAPAVPEPTHHADPDLRLQQDHAPAGKKPGGGAE